MSGDLVADGWQRRHLDDRSIATLTRDTGGRVLATVELRRTRFTWPDDWPTEVGVGLGVGFEPALNLMPILTMDTHVALLDADDEDRPRFTVALDGGGDVAFATQWIVAVVTEQAVPYAARFADAAAIEAALCDRNHLHPSRSSTGVEAEVEESCRDDITRRRLLLRAAMGRHDEARTLLSTYPSQRDEPIDRADRRFIRQLTRWLDAGGAAAPPIAQTLAQLPREPKPPRPSWTGARAASKQRSAARDAVKAQITDQSVEEIIAILAAEHARRNIDVSPTELALAAQGLHVQHQLRQRPFGCARSTLAGLRMLAGGARDVPRAFRSTPQDVPQWLQPPERASYRMTRGNNSVTAVTVDPDAYSWLTRAWTETPRRVGFLAGVDVWLTTDHESGELIAHIGDRRVGTVPAASTGAYSRVLRAAELFDEDPVARGLLSRLHEAGPLTLEIQIPDPEPPAG